MSKDNNFEVPFQVQSLIDSLNNKKEGVHVRGNYRSRLGAIHKAIDKAIYDYDMEMGTVQPLRYKKGQR